MATGALQTVTSCCIFSMVYVLFGGHYKVHCLLSYHGEYWTGIPVSSRSKQRTFLMAYLQPFKFRKV